MAFAAMASWHKVPWKENGLSRVLHNVNFVKCVLCKNVTQSSTFSRLIFCENFCSHEIETDDENLRLPFLVHKSDRNTPRVKSQARSQNNRSRALK